MDGHWWRMAVALCSDHYHLVPLVKNMQTSITRKINIIDNNMTTSGFFLTHPELSWSVSVFSIFLVINWAMNLGNPLGYMMGMTSIVMKLHYVRASRWSGLDLFTIIRIETRRIDDVGFRHISSGRSGPDIGKWESSPIVSLYGFFQKVYFE